MVPMNSSKTAAFSKSELAALNVWQMPDVSAIPLVTNVVKSEKPAQVAPAEPAVPVLTVDEIEAMQKQAYEEAFAQGKQDGYNIGYGEGSKRGYEEHKHALEQKVTAFTELMEALNEPFKALDAEVEQELVKLAISMATQIIRREIKLDPGQIIAAVREAIKVLPVSSQNISLHLHPEDAELVRSALSLDDMSSAWKITEDPLITRGGCKVNTEISHIDATLENRLAAVIAGVLGGERERDQKGAKARTRGASEDSSL